MKTTNKDWFDKLSLAQQKSILKGLNDIENNYIIAHSKVRAKVNQLIKKAKV